MCMRHFFLSASLSASASASAKVSVCLHIRILTEKTMYVAMRTISFEVQPGMVRTGNSSGLLHQFVATVLPYKSGLATALECCISSRLLHQSTARIKHMNL